MYVNQDNSVNKTTQTDFSKQFRLKLEDHEAEDLITFIEEKNTINSLHFTVISQVRNNNSIATLIIEHHRRNT